MNVQMFMYVVLTVAHELFQWNCGRQRKRAYFFKGQIVSGHSTYVTLANVTAALFWATSRSGHLAG